MKQKLLEVKNLSVKLKKDNKTLVKDLNFTIDRNRSLGIIGESGSGKTLTSKAILGLLDTNNFIVNGNVIYNNQEILNLKGKSMSNIRGKQISMIMQNPMTAFAPMLTIKKQLIDTLTYHLKLNKKEANRIVLREMSKINLSNPEKIMNSYPNELSGGMLQRVMIALTLSLEPKLIIADEATTAVDSISEQMILKELKDVKKRGISLLIITHDFGVAATLADELLVMKNGKIIEKGLTNNLLSFPKDWYTKQLLSASVLMSNCETKGGIDYATDKEYCKKLQARV